MATIINWEQIKGLLPTIDLLPLMEEGFKAYSAGKVIVPPVGEMLFEEPPGDVHIKYGYIKGDDYYVIKIASGFYQNSQRGISPNQGMMLIFDQKTGQEVAILLDKGNLTDARTAAAGALVAKYYAPKEVKAIGIIGTGIQARLQLEYLNSVVDCKKVWVWGRTKARAEEYKAHFEALNYTVNIATSPSQLALESNLIVTTTPAKAPILKAIDIQAGTHITAMGSDTAEKIELEPALLSKADIRIVDSLPQSYSRGEIYRAVKAGTIKHVEVAELGKALSDPSLQRQNDEQITIADLTGVAIQDIQIAKAVYQKIKK